MIIILVFGYYMYIYRLFFYVFDHRMILLLFCVFSTERQGHLEADIYLWLFATTKVQLYKVLYVNTSVVWFRRPGKFWNMIDHIFAIVFSFPQLLHWGVTLRGMAKKIEKNCYYLQITYTRMSVSKYKTVQRSFSSWLKIQFTKKVASVVSLLSSITSFSNIWSCKFMLIYFVPARREWLKKILILAVMMSLHEVHISLGVIDRNSAHECQRQSQNELIIKSV